MKSLFADTWYFLALLNERDEGHECASDFVLAPTDTLVTTAWVLTEVADALTGDSHFQQAGFQALLV